MKSLVLGLALATALAVPPVAADPAKVKATITAQLDAFRSGDADAAYALAAPSIRRLFPTAERFAAMVEKGYGPLFDGSAPTFLRGRATEEGVYAQEVGLTDRSGRSWTALYTLAEQDDGSWRITGCYLKAAEGQNI